MKNMKNMKNEIREKNEWMNEFFFSLSFSLSLFLSPQQGGVGCVFSCPCGSGAVPARSRRGPGAVSARFLPGFPETGGPCSRGGRLLLSNLNQRGQSDARTSKNLRESLRIFENLWESLRILKSEERASPEQFQSGFRAASEQLQGSCCLGATALGEDAAPMKFWMKRFNLIFHKIRSD